MNVRKKSLFAVFFTFAIDNLGATIIFPIFAPLFLDPQYHLIGREFLLKHKNILLGWFLAIYPIMQFLLSPIFGDYTDHAGRRRTLLFTSVLTCVGFGVCALSITHHNLIFLFLGRMLMGIGAGNLPICMSILSDLSTSPKQRVKYFSYGSALAGGTFVLGPLLGGNLSDPSLLPFFSIAFPMWFGGALALMNVLFIAFAFTETIREKVHTPYDFLKGLHNIRQALKSKSLGHLYIVYFLYLFAWNLFFQFMPPYAIEKFKIGPAKIGNIAALMGLCWICGSGVIAKFFHSTKNLRYVLATWFFAFAIFTHFTNIPSTLLGFVTLVAFSTMASSVIWPLYTGMIASAAPEKMQGKVLGLSQSVLSLSMVVSAILGGYFLEYNLHLPFVFAGVALLLAIIWILTHLEKHSEI